MNYADVKPDLIRWARRRAGQSPKNLLKKFPKIELWERGEKQPTLKRLEKFAKAMHVPVGYLFLERPPEEKPPIPDFRRTAKAKFNGLSPNLLETVYICQRRQDWYRDHQQAEKKRLLAFIGSARPLESHIVKTAENIGKVLKFDLEERKNLPTWTAALNRFIETANSKGVLVMRSGVAGNNTRRKLDPEEFRGFALSDPLAPLIFINSADTKAAQMFTLAHELAHLWIDQTALSNAQALHASDSQADALSLNISERRIESWCNKVAAELLVPLKIFQKEAFRAKNTAGFAAEVERLARRFKVSSLVILRRLYDAKQITFQELNRKYQEELQKIKALKKKRKAGGGNFFLTFNARISPSFTKALAVSALEGYTPFREAFQLLGVRKTAVFKKIIKNFNFWISNALSLRRQYIDDGL